MNAGHRSSALAEQAVAYLEEMGGVERSPFPEEWEGVHDDLGSVGEPVEVVRQLREDGLGMVAVAFFELKDGTDLVARPGEGRRGVAVVHDTMARARAFVFNDPAAFDDAVTDSDIRGMLRE